MFLDVQVAPHVRDVRTSSVACGVGNMFGNKGGVAISCTLAGAVCKGGRGIRPGTPMIFPANSYHTSHTPFSSFNLVTKHARLHIR